ncbi:hypothetical protein [Rhodopseudomonas sp. BR0G17]|uniref:hypothetical protein n=1 Tax=Rhodopseudomonas sp. BR0G17 TaxID=2269368 RepID=UPI0013DF2E30|nr:hypothetical protein [Rhodopseudomonas sp. BR0G17]NEW96653.1 hypothetical protein [Rhodopseudomonas sp. BR0G17]
MTTDILGPASAGGVTTRPADDRTIGAVDTYWIDCSGPGKQDGTQIRAAWFNKMQQQLRNAIDGMGVPRDPSDDDMLLKAIRAAKSLSVSIDQFARTIPIYPGISTGSGKMTITAGSGSLTIDAAQSWTRRGYFIYSTDQFASADRTFATTANKTYHLRWIAPGQALAPATTYPNGRFMLRDLADATYNPTAAAETAITFDSAFDDMLIARVTTDGSNALTVLPLYNLPVLAGDTAIAYSGTKNADASGRLVVKCSSIPMTLNWARSPNRGGAAIMTQSSPANPLQPHTEYFATVGGLVPQIDRYGVSPVFVVGGYSAGASVSATIEMTLSVQGRQ